MLRFAPSPRGDMDIGMLHIALLNYMVSVQNNEGLVVRIEDIDKNRNIEGKDKEILDILNLFSIEYKHVTNQSDSLKYHTQFAMKLLMDKKAFNCFCSDAALENDEDEAIKEKKPYRYNNFCENLSDELTIGIEAPFTVRIKKPKENIKFSDLIKGDIDCSGFDIDSFIILKHDKTPTYNFACAVDDMLSNISTVIRDEKYLLDTAKQIHIRNTLSYEKVINYVHVPKILNISTNKDTSSVKYLIEEGFLPVAIANYLVLLGNEVPKDENENAVEIFTIEEALTWFDIKQISKEVVEFDIEKLKFINNEHLKAIDELRLSKLLGYSDKDIGALAKIYLEECDTLKELKEKINTIFNEKEILKDFEEEYNKIVECINASDFMYDFNDFKTHITKQTLLEEDSLLIPLQYALTGEKIGPSLSKIYPLIKNYIGEIIK